METKEGKGGLGGGSPPKAKTIRHWLQQYIFRKISLICENLLKSRKELREEPSA